MPAVFVGHGPPMNGIENNEYAAVWIKAAERRKRPVVILSDSIHWFTLGTRVMDSPAPKMIYDIHGFPTELYQITYKAPGSPHFAPLLYILGASDKTDHVHVFNDSCVLGAVSRTSYLSGS